MSVII